MLKFLRKYNKWLLAVFCVVLMFVFLIPQAQQQFSPDSTKATMATIYDGEEISREDVNKAVGVLQMTNRLGLDNVRLPGLALVPNSESELDNAMQWLLIQRAAEHNGISASRLSAFNLVASVLDVQNEEELKAKAAEMQASSDFIIEVGKQYLIAEQYRQLVGGIEFTKPEGASQISSPGLQRLDAINNLNRLINAKAQQYQFLPPDQARFLVFQELFTDPIAIQVITQITGHPRVTAEQLHYLLQQQMTEVDLTVIVLDAEDRVAGITVSEEEVRETFERYAEDRAGTGEPYGLGYRVPDRVKAEALRIPFDTVREVVEKEVTREDVRQFYDNNRADFIDFAALSTEDNPKPKPLTAVLSEEIRVLLVQQRAQEKVIEIAQAARLRLNEDARGLKDDGPFKVLPEGFKPTPLVEVAGEIEKDFGVSPEIIVVDNWVSGREINAQMRFTQAVLSEVPGSTIKLPVGGFSTDNTFPVREMILAGRAGLFASAAPEVGDNRGQPTSFAQYINYAKPFVDPGSQQARFGLQPNLPGRILIDLTGSSYVFRITDTDPAHSATDLAPIADKVREDTRKIKAYEELAAEKDALLERAAGQSIESLMAKADAKQTLTALTRQLSSRPGAVQIKGLNNTAPIVVQAFGVADKLLAAGGVAAADPADRLFVVELAGDYKIAVVRVDAIRPMTRRAFQGQVDQAGVLASAANLPLPQTEQPPAPLSLDALKAATGFKWEEGFGPENLDDDEESAESKDEEDE